jgi:hypothetical protein
VRPPARLFLDAGIVIDSTYNRWGSSKDILILVTIRAAFRAIIAEPVAEEIRRNLRTRTDALPESEAERIMDGFETWYRIARPERVPWPTDHEMVQHAGLLAAVRHENDMPAVVAAVLSRPDWVLSTNTEHWNEELARRTGMRVAHPAAFLAGLHA